MIILVVFHDKSDSLYWLFLGDLNIVSLHSGMNQTGEASTRIIRLQLCHSKGAIGALVTISVHHCPK